MELNGNGGSIPIVIAAQLSPLTADGQQVEARVHAIAKLLDRFRAGWGLWPIWSSTERNCCVQR